MQAGTPLVPPSSARDDIRDALATEQWPVDGFPYAETLTGLAVAVLIVLVVFFVRRKLRPKPAETMELRARRRLAELAAHPAPDSRAFHAELADILLRYMEARVGLPSSRLTSREIVRAFQTNGHMSAEWRERLEELLAECDRAKFAPAFDADWDPSDTARRGRVILDALAIQVAAAPRLASPWEGWGDAAV
ncbi:MAG: hypothetical protein JWP63_5573 [Candidatus Solibacter sp.]|nr:hypothetical protein [Candidatus Solibacter sp.]